MSIFDMLAIVGVSFTGASFFSMVLMKALADTEGEKSWKSIVVTLLMLLIGIVCLLISVPKVSKEYHDECKKISKMRSKLLEYNSELYPQLAKLDGYKIYYNGGDKPIDIEDIYRKAGDDFLGNTIIEKIGDPFNKKAIYIVRVRLDDSDDFSAAKKYLETNKKKQIGE